MARKDDEIEKNSEFRLRAEADERAWKRLIGYVKLACFISINAILAGAYVVQQTGSFIYKHSPPVKSWIDGILAAIGKG